MLLLLAATIAVNKRTNWSQIKKPRCALLRKQGDGKGTWRRARSLPVCAGRAKWAREWQADGSNADCCQKLDYRLLFIDGDLFRSKYYTPAKKLSSSAIFSA
jgi:hypothetical protein